MSSTHTHVVMYNAFDWEPPTYAHVGLLQDPSRQKFSKRDSSLNIRSFEQDGIFPEALINYIALFGWSHTLGDDFLTREALVKNVRFISYGFLSRAYDFEQFDLKFTKGNTIVVPTKLKHLQKRYAQKFVEEKGKQWDSMVKRLLVEVQQQSMARSEYATFSCEDNNAYISIVMGCSLITSTLSLVSSSC